MPLIDRHCRGEFVFISEAGQISKATSNQYTDMYYDHMRKAWYGRPKKDCAKSKGKPNCVNCGAPKLAALCEYCGTTT